MKKSCPCNSKHSYMQCCGQYILNNIPAPTPEALMRSRYTAYTKADINYIVRTMRGAANKDFDSEAAKQWARTIKWLGLKIIHSSQEGNHGIVEFIATYSEHQRISKMHEVSLFEFEDGYWYYVGAHSSTNTLDK